MSAGLTYEELVTQVLYVEEKVLLDGLYPSDDKFREVITEANLMLQEFQNTEDWLWLRKRWAIGRIPFQQPTEPPFTIPSFKINTEVIYKLSTMYGDAVHLYLCNSNDIYEDPDDYFDIIIPHNRIDVPIVSPGFNDEPMVPSVGKWNQPNIPTFPLGCFILDDQLTFNRWPIEALGRAVVIDCQERIPPLHVCNDECVGIDPSLNGGAVNWEKGDNFNPCTFLYKNKNTPYKILTMVPDPNYVVYKTAYYHALGSPVAQGNLSYINDVCAKLLSGIRNNDNETTRPDIVRRYTPRWIEAI